MNKYYRHCICPTYLTTTLYIHYTILTHTNYTHLHTTQLTTTYITIHYIHNYTLHTVTQKTIQKCKYTTYSNSENNTKM